MNGVIEALSKIWYLKFAKSKSSLKDVTRLEQSRGLDEKNQSLETVMAKYDLLQVFEIVFPQDPTLKCVTLKLKDDGSLFVQSLLKNFRNFPPAAILASLAWYGAFGNFKYDKRNEQTFGRDMSWTILHFKQHIDPVLHNDVELRLHTFETNKQGRPLYFAILMDEIVT